jgi:hypothetical protein
MKKIPYNLPASTATGRKCKKGNSIPKTQKNRSTGRYFKVEIHLTKSEYTRGLPYFEAEKNLKQFISDAYREKINRAEANDKAARLRILILKEMYARRKLDFIKKTDNGIGRENVI